MSDSFVIVCRRKSVKRCLICGYLGSYLCDYPVKKSKSKTCDKPLCGKCRTNVRDGVDLCPMHARVYETRTAVLEKSEARKT